MACSRAAFWELARFKHPTHQISFHTARRGSVVQAPGPEGVQMIHGHADVFHCEPIEKVYARLIEDISGQDDVAETLITVYTSWIDKKLSDYNSSFYYQSRDYIAECYRTVSVIDA